LTTKFLILLLMNKETSMLKTNALYIYVWMSAHSDISNVKEKPTKALQANVGFSFFYVDELPVMKFLSISTSESMFRGWILCRTFFSTSGVQYIFRSC